MILREINPTQIASLRFNTISFWSEVDLLNNFPRPIKRFEIHCAGVLCTHYDADQLSMRNTQNWTIGYFLLDVGHFPLVSMNECLKNYQSCVLMTTINFIKKMCNIRYVRIITHKYNLDKLVDANEWKNLVHDCHHLKKVTLEVLGSMLQRDALKRKALEIEKVIQNV
jgi:hypothetical protein